MKICFVGPANSAHIEKWCNWFSERGHEIHVISFVPAEIKGAKVHLIDLCVDAQGSDLRKLKYLTSGKKIKNIIRRINPDVVNAHYATSYGVAVALSGIKNYVLSVWGSDIYDFPRKSPLHKVLLKYSLWKAPYLFSTSRAMAKEGSKYAKKEFKITPFGVDMVLFNPNKRTRPENDCNEFVVGTVKGLSDKYGIADIIKAVAIIKNEGKIPIKLRIAGKGPKEKEYKQLCKNLGIEDITTWLGFISQEEVAKEWANMDVAIVASTLDSESFGVSAVEAQACGTAVIVTDVPGLMEATKPGESSIVVKRRDSVAISKKIVCLYKNESIRKKMEKNGKRYVSKNYELNKTFENIEELLKKIVFESETLTCKD